MKESVFIGKNEVAIEEEEKHKTESTIFLYRFPRVCNHLACERFVLDLDQ